MRGRKQVVAAFVSAVVFVVGVPGAGATADATAIRIAGADRYATALQIATSTFTEATVAVLASGTSFADALSASYFSGASAAPVLLTAQDHLSDGVLDTLAALGVTGVVVVGGEASVSSAVVDELEAAGLTVDRFAGIDRYETARKMAELLPASFVGVYGAGPTAIVATGESFPDALASGPMSAGERFPILLTTAGTLHPEARAALASLDIAQVIVIGGDNAVSAAVTAEITAMGIVVERVAGATRQATAVAVAELVRDQFDFPIDRVLLSRGDVFADALAGGSLGGQVRAPLLLTDSLTALGEASRSFIAGNASTIAEVSVLGGSSAVADETVNAALAAARAQ